MHRLSPAFRGFGSKWRIAPFIIRHFPDHLCYVEPFGYTASVLVQKEPAYLEVYNDLDEEAFNFFEMLNYREDDLLRAIYLTPYGRGVLERSYEPTDDPLKRAVRFYIQKHMCFGHRKNGYRFQHSDNGYRILSKWNNSHNNLSQIALRFKEVQLEKDHAFNVIERYDKPHTLFYVDPPYLLATRTDKNTTYAHEMTEQEHVELAQRLRNIKGMAVVSHHRCEMYDWLYQGWQQASKQIMTNGGSRREEVIYLHPNNFIL